MTGPLPCATTTILRLLSAVLVLPRSDFIDIASELPPWHFPTPPALTYFQLSGNPRWRRQERGKSDTSSLWKGWRPNGDFLTAFFWRLLVRPRLFLLLSSSLALHPPLPPLPGQPSCLHVQSAGCNGWGRRGEGGERLDSPPLFLSLPDPVGPGEKRGQVGRGSLLFLLPLFCRGLVTFFSFLAVSPFFA